MNYKYKIGDEIIIVSKLKYKLFLVNKIGKITSVFYGDFFPYDVDFDDKKLNDYFSFAEDEIRLSSEPLETEINTNLNQLWTPEQITKMYECLVGTYPLIKRFVDEMTIDGNHDLELLSNAQFWLAGFQSYKHD